MNDQDFEKSLNGSEKEILEFWKGDLGVFIMNKVTNVLEIGSGWGIFARIILMLYPDVKLRTVDKQANLADFDKNTMGYLDRIERVIRNSSDFLKDEPADIYDLVFVDGDHSHDMFVSDFREAWRVAKVGGYIVCDDVYHAKNWPNGDYGTAQGMLEMVKEFKCSTAVYPVSHGIAIFKKK